MSSNITIMDMFGDKEWLNSFFSKIKDHFIIIQVAFLKLDVEFLIPSVDFPRIHSLPFDNH